VSSQGQASLSPAELEHLAERVYRLMQEDIRLNRARGDVLPEHRRG
jgi:hypothetical protein